jgi:hypothetical protein
MAIEQIPWSAPLKWSDLRYVFDIKVGRISIGVLARHWSAKAAGLKIMPALEPEIDQS